MKRLLPILVLSIFFFVLLPVQRVNAQHEDYPPLPADAWKGQVSGKVVNQTTGKTVTEPVEVMLHAWDPDEQERLAYNLAYTGKLSYTYLAPVAIAGVSFLVQEGSGLSLQGNDLTADGERTLQDGSKFNVYTASGLKPGESMQLTLSGKAEGGTVSSTAATGRGGNIELGIGAGVLGLALLGIGVWWWRRRGNGELEEISEATIEGLLAELQDLDQVYERGELPVEEYLENRTNLRNRLKAATNSLPQETTISNIPGHPFHIRA